MDCSKVGGWHSTEMPSSCICMKACSFRFQSVWTRLNTWKEKCQYLFLNPQQLSCSLLPLPTNSNVCHYWSPNSLQFSAIWANSMEIHSLRNRSGVACKSIIDSLERMHSSSILRNFHFSHQASRVLKHVISYQDNSPLATTPISYR